jgi:hypothetical protein
MFIFIYLFYLFLSLGQAMRSSSEEESKNDLVAPQNLVQFNDDQLVKIQGGRLLLGMTAKEWDQRCRGAKELGYSLFQEDHESVFLSLKDLTGALDYIRSDFNDLDFLGKIASLTKGKLKEIIMDYGAWFFTRWTSHHLKHFYTMLEEGGEFVYRPDIQRRGTIPLCYIHPYYFLGARWTLFLKKKVQILDKDPLKEKIFEIMRDTLSRNQGLYGPDTLLITGKCEGFQYVESDSGRVVGDMYEKLLKDVVIPQHVVMWEAAGFRVSCSEEPFPIPIPVWRENAYEIVPHLENEKKWLVRAKKVLK